MHGNLFFGVVALHLRFWSWYCIVLIFKMYLFRFVFAFFYIVLYFLFAGSGVLPEAVSCFNNCSVEANNAITMQTCFQKCPFYCPSNCTSPLNGHCNKTSGLCLCEIYFFTGSNCSTSLPDHPDTNTFHSPEGVFRVTPKYITCPFLKLNWRTDICLLFCFIEMEKFPESIIQPDHHQQKRSLIFRVQCS